jgi:N-acetylglucosamine-6-phosphate deacetylase
MSSMTMRNCKLLNQPGTVSLRLQGGTIQDMSRTIESDSDPVMDARGRLLVPGFIEVHIQGAGGADILDATEASLRAIAHACARYGTTAYLATTVFKPGQTNHHLPFAADHVNRDLGGARLLGIHLEGPFISTVKRGMIQPECLGPPALDILDEIYDLCGEHLSMMTISPELPNCAPIIQSLMRRKTIASLGHTHATYEETLAAFASGIHHVTHLFNAMPGLHHREPGPLTAIFENPEVTVQIITDGVHIHPAVLGQAVRLLGPDRILTITDGMQALGLPPGKYTYNGIPYESIDGAARYHDGTLIGTAVGLIDLVKRLVDYSDLTLEEAVQTVTLNPARLLGLEKTKGSIAVGKDADLVLLNEDLSVHATIVAGEVVYQE